MLLCSHLLADVQDVCDRITILYGGKMQKLGHVRDLLQVKDITQVQARQLTDGQIAQLREFLVRIGAQDATVTHPTTSLEELFMRVIGESATGNGFASRGDVYSDDELRRPPGPPPAASASPQASSTSTTTTHSQS